jgi:hypothetical protein
MARAEIVGLRTQAATLTSERAKLIAENAELKTTIARTATERTVRAAFASAQRVVAEKDVAEAVDLVAGAKDDTQRARILELCVGAKPRSGEVMTIVPEGGVATYDDPLRAAMRAAEADILKESPGLAAHKVTKRAWALVAERNPHLFAGPTESA